MTLELRDGVMSEIERHAFSDTAREVGGILVGSINGRSATVTGVIPALRATSGSANVTFTHEVWEDVHATIAADFPEQRIVGWYHTHPGFGIFLSEYDRFIQTNFFSDPAMRALVVDPLAGEAGWFEWVNSSITPGETFPTETPAVRPPGAPASAAASSSTSRTSRAAAVLGTAAALVVGAVGGYLYAGTGDDTRRPPTPVASVEGETTVQEENETLRAELAEARAAAAAAGRAPASAAPLEYRVQRGDTLWRLAAGFYGSGFEYSRIAEANPGSEGGLEVGQQLVIPREDAQ